MARSNISSEISKLSKQKIIPATVIDVLGKFCSIRLSGGGKLLRGLIFLGASPAIGDTVYVDYRSGTPIVHTASGNVDTAIETAARVTVAPVPAVPTPTEPMPHGGQHNDLSGIQGGLIPTEAVPAEYYHLTEVEHANLGGGAGGGHIILDEGVPLPAEPNLDFAGTGVIVTDDDYSDTTLVTIEGAPIATRAAVFTFEGRLTATGGAVRIYNKLGVAAIISQVYLTATVVPNGAAIIVDIHKNGTTIFTDQAHRPQIADGAHTGFSTTIDVPAWADGEYLSADMDQVGSAYAGEDLTVHVIATFNSPMGGGDVFGPATNTDGYIPQWNGADSKTLKNGLLLATAVANPGVDTSVPTEKAVRDAIVAGEGIPISYLDTDGTLAANSDVKVASQKATKTYADQLIAAANALVYKGTIDCSGNPNYPAANAGDLYVVSVAGKIGGVSGIVVDVGDMCICNTDATASGDQATVGTKWNIIEKNIVGAVSGPASATADHLAVFDGATGKLIKDGGALTGAGVPLSTLNFDHNLDQTVTDLQALAEAVDELLPVAIIAAPPTAEIPGKWTAIDTVGLVYYIWSGTNWYSLADLSLLADNHFLLENDSYFLLESGYKLDLG